MVDWKARASSLLSVQSEFLLLGHKQVREKLSRLIGNTVFQMNKTSLTVSML